MQKKYSIPKKYHKYKTFIEEYVDNYFMGLLNQDIYASVCDGDGVCIIATNKSAKSIGLTHGFEVTGLSYKNIDANAIQKYCYINNIEDTNTILKLIQKLQKIREIVVRDKVIISYLDIIPYKQTLEATLVCVSPIIYKKDNTVVLLQTVASRFQLFGIYDYLKESQQNISELSQKINLCTNEELPFAIHLTNRQHEILYLLALGLSQDSVARILQINRGTIATIVSEQLCPKFSIHGSSTRILVAKAIEELDITKYIPKTLYKPLIIILDPDIERKYFI